MLQNRVWHGCLFLAVGTLLSPIVEGQEPLQIRSTVVDIEYTINEDALPLEFVQLWYTVDRGVSWRDFGFDKDRQSPITFRAPKEGLYGLLLVVGNATGPSSAPPTSATEPHLWIFFDATPPVVQLHPLRQTTVLGLPALQIRWSAIDAQLGSRPVEIAYQHLPDETWQPVTPEPLANTGRYDWRLPESVQGRVAVRLTVTDQGGNRVTSTPQVIEVASALEQRPIVLASSPGPGPDRRGVNSTTALHGSVRAAARASRLYREALAHSQRGEYREGIARLREAVKLNPQWAAAFADMADMLYRIGDLDRALNAYELALQQKPKLRGALRGAAMVYQQQNDHAAASRMLRTILRHSPDDAEVWMNLGDVAVYQGDEVLARECYTRATQIDPSASQVIADARKRLELMGVASRRYRPGRN